MTKLQELYAHNPAQRDQWVKLWANTGRDPWGHPAYSELYRHGGEDRVVCLVDAEGTYMPLLLRPTPGGLVDGSIDAVSPYGYGGPFGPPSAALPFLRLIADWTTSNNVVSIFGRLSLNAEISEQFVSGSARISESANNVRVDTSRPLEAIKRGYDHKVRKNINKALRAGCVVERLDDLDVHEFNGIYLETMSRRGAAPAYYFDPDFFERIQSSDINFSYYRVLDDLGVVISVELVLLSDSEAFSFLGGTKSSAFPKAPNDLLKHQMIMDAAQAGRHWVVLGGGYEPDDGIFRYKRSFSREGVIPYYTFRGVGNEQRYCELVDAHLRAALDGGSGGPGDYFPAYRAPIRAR